MAVVEIVIPLGPASQQTVEFDGVIVGLRLWWNARAQRWILDVTDQAGAEIASGLGLVIGRSLLARFGARPDMPPGSLVAVDTSGAGREAGRDDLGDRVRLVYADAAELAAAGVG